MKIIRELAKEPIKLRDLLKLKKYFIGYIQIHKFIHSVQLHASPHSFKKTMLLPNLIRVTPSPVA